MPINPVLVITKVSAPFFISKLIWLLTVMILIEDLGMDNKHFIEYIELQIKETKLMQKQYPSSYANLQRVINGWVAAKIKLEQESKNGF